MKCHTCGGSGRIVIQDITGNHWMYCDICMGGGEAAYVINPWIEKDLPSRHGRPGDSQKMPIPNDLVDIQTLVIRDIETRRKLGIERYGTGLQADNGRDALLDLYEELLDAVMYLKQMLEER